MKKIILSVCLLCACISISAQTKWTLRQCLDYALAHNLDIQKQAVAVESAEVDVKSSKNSRLPNLGANVGTGLYFGRVASLSTGVYESTASATNNNTLGVTSSIPVYRGGAIANTIQINELNLLANMEGLKKAKENIQIQVAGYYLEVLFKKEILGVYIQQVNLSDEQVTRTEILVESGKVPKSQLFDIKAQLAKDQLNVTMATNDLEMSLLNLAQSLNMMDPSQFDIEDPIVGDVIADNRSSIVPPDQVFALAEVERPHVKEALYLLESSQKKMQLARSAYYPSVDLNLAYNNGFSHIYNSQLNQNLSQQLDYNSRQSVYFTVSIPIFNRFDTRNRVRSAKIQVHNMELNLDNVKLALFKEIQLAYQEATAAEAKFLSTEAATQAAQESFKYAQDRYDIGKSTVFELNDARTKLFSSLSSQAQAKYEFLFRAKILDFYSGKPIDIQ